MFSTLDANFEAVQASCRQLDWQCQVIFPLPIKVSIRLYRDTRVVSQLIKNEPLEITYSYWDGTGHRRKVVVKKGNTIGDFLKACRDQARILQGQLFVQICRPFA